MSPMDINKIFEDKRYLFWTLQFGGWFGWAFVFYLGVLVWGRIPDGYVIYLPIVSTIGMLISLVLRKLYHATWDWEISRRVLVILIGSWCAGAAWMASRAAIFYQLFPAERKPFEEHGMEFFSYFDGSISATWVMLVWSALYFGVKYYLLLQEEKQRGLKMMAMAHEAQLKMLRYQLNPHFLFNTLNAISTLMLDKDTELANTMVTRLSRFLRYSLDNDPMQKVTVVSQEMEALRLYLDIEKVRFDERLQAALRHRAGSHRRADAQPAAAAAGGELDQVRHRPGHQRRFDRRQRQGLRRRAAADRGRRRPGPGPEERQGAQGRRRGAGQHARAPA